MKNWTRACLVAIEAGAIVIQPGGSMRDDEVNKAADDDGRRGGVHRGRGISGIESRL